MEQSFFFYANPYQPSSLEAARALAESLSRRGARIISERWLAGQGIGEEADESSLAPGVRAAVVFGGDGTLLRAAPEAVRQGIPLLGVNTGTVGFLMPGRKDRPEETAALLTQAVYPTREYPLLEVRHQGKKYLCVNDVSLTRGEHPGVIETEITADGETVFCAHGDGAVVSTPLGATAYGLSAGGPIVRPDTPCLMAVPLCARELLLRPVILPLHAKIALSAHGQERRRLQLAVDGQTLLPVTEDVTVDIALSALRISLIQPETPRFFSTLRRKQAYWNEYQLQQE